MILACSEWPSALIYIVGLLVVGVVCLALLAPSNKK